MKKNTKYTIIILCVLIVFIGGGYYLLKQSTKVSKNPAGTVGNSAGNLQNGGLYCESEGVVYFSNPYDNHFLYAMNSDETNCHRVNTSMVRLINSGKEDLYYYQYDTAGSDEYGFISNLGGLFRSSKKGGRTVCLKKNTIGGALLIDNTIYYLNYKNKGGYDLYRIGVDKTKDELVLDGIVDPSCYSNQSIYYQVQDSKEEHHLYRYDLSSQTTEPVFAKDIWYPQAFGSFIYYLDIHNNYALCRYDTMTGSDVTLVSDRIDCYNVTGEYIYFQVNSKEDPYLGMITYDGSNKTRIASGNFTNLNATTKYLYFNAFGADTPVYHVPIGTTNVSTFSAGMEAMKKYNK